MQSFSSDIIIVGGGLTGTALALALAKHTPLSIILLDAKGPSSHWSADTYHHRVSAITLASQRIFQALQCWESMQTKRISPFQAIQVWDAQSMAEIYFGSEEIAEPLLGFIIENQIMQMAMEEKCHTFPSIKKIAPVQLLSYEEKEDGVVLMSADQHLYRAKLAIAADGMNSWLRDQAGIEMIRHDYDQAAIVATVHTTLAHDKTARQVFLKTGPLAFLPLNRPHLSSIVWSLPFAEAKRLHELDAPAFMENLANAFSQRLGTVHDISDRHLFPLYKQQAAQYVKSRVVLMGDAAHTIHPLAGQGINMGLLDAASLAEVITDAVNHRHDFSSARYLRSYERWRKADNFALINGVDWIKQFFASDKKMVCRLRSFGLNKLNQSRWIKNQFTHHAVGNRQGLPRLAK